MEKNKTTKDVRVLMKKKEEERAWQKISKGHYECRATN